MPTGPRHFMVMPDFSRASIPSIGKMDRTRSVRPSQRERERERGRGSRDCCLPKYSSARWFTMIDEWAILTVLSFGVPCLKIDSNENTRR